MTRKLFVATAALLMASAAGAQAADQTVVKAPPAPPPTIVEVVQDCSVFYEGYRRSFGWGSTGIGFGAVEGALPRYPYNEFPNWYGLCTTPGHYSASGSAFGITGAGR